MMTTKNIIIATILSILFLTNCRTIKTVQLLKGGEVIQKEFLAEIPFEYRLGLIILKVKIKGIEYDFVLDTGAPNVVSKELAETLNLESKITQKVEDSNNNGEDLVFTKIDNIKIGELDFNNTGVVISDIRSSQEVACLKIDGFIGSNLMRKAIWKFDYQRQIITITNRLDSLKIPSKVLKIPFYPEITGTPLCDIKINNQMERNIVIDIGSNGDITLSNKTYRKIYDPKNKLMTSYGRSGSGLYGTGIVDTTKYIIASSINFGDVELKNTIAEFSTGSSTIGMDFFKNYDLIIDWFKKTIILIERNQYSNSTIDNYGFSWINEGQKLYISYITVGSNAEKLGLKLGDQLINIDGTDYTTISKEMWCNMLEGNSTGDEINITILRDNKKLNFKLFSEILLK